VDSPEYGLFSNKYKKDKFLIFIVGQYSIKVGYMKKKISITIDVDIHEWAIKNANKERITLSAFINRLASYYKINEEQSTKPHNVLLSSKS